MSRMKELLNNIVNGRNMCALCLKEVDDDNVYIHDETIMKCNNTKTIIELISFVLGDEFQLDENCQFMENLCSECSTLAISCYTFMETCRASHITLHRVLTNLTDCINNTDSLYSGKALYFSVQHNMQCKINCDRKRAVKSKRKALKRFRSLSKKKLKKKSIKIEHDSYDLVSPDIVNEVSCEESKVHTCKHCLKIFHRSTNLRSHYLRVHAPKDFKCSECPKKFGSAYLLKLHLTESHITVICSDCGKTYNNIHSLKMHEVSHQDNLICPQCGKRYKNKISFKRHLKLQSCGTVRTVIPYDKNKTLPDYRYECDICNKRFTQKGSLRVHIKFEHENGKAYICSWCSKKFSAQSKLKAHVVKHTRERNFTCDICGGKFVTKEALLYHTRIHTGEKPYPCPQCDERFLSASRRMEHMRRKHWGPTLECDICSSRFKTSFCLRKHKMRHFDPNSRLYTQEAPDGVEV